MGKCLIERLKESVNDDSLDVIGTLVIRNFVNSSKIAIIDAASANALNITVLDGNTIASVRHGSNTLVDSKHAKIGVGTLPPNGFVLTNMPETSPAYVMLRVENKYEAKDLRFATIEGGLSRLRACKKLESLYLYAGEGTGLSMSGSLADLSGLTKLKVISNAYKNTDITGNLSDLSELVDLEALSLFETSCYGDIQYLGTCTQLRQIMLGYHRQVTGSIENFVARQRGAGRTTLAEENKLDLGVPSLWGVYFNGEPATRSSRTYLYWDANTITFGGTTINNDDVITP